MSGAQPASLRQQFSDDFSSGAFRRIDGEQRIVGKFGQITQAEDGSFDCWFVGPDLSPLSGRRMANIAREIAVLRGNLAVDEGLIILTGEGYIQGAGRDFVLRMAPLAGIKRKRRLSAKTAEANTERLAKLREVSA